jgi:molybdopterin-guanine dinucleotide biosynthesis protein A
MRIAAAVMDDTFSSASMPGYSTIDFTAVLLAGGKSSRMGQDKAGLMIEGVPLWRRQLATLQATGATEILISGRLDGSYAESGFPIMEDMESDLGPLGGIATTIAMARHTLVLVLAIDLPRMTGAFLQSLLPSAPVVPRRVDRFEPLAAVYSRNCLEVFQRRLVQHHLSLQSAIHELAERGDVSICDVPTVEAPLFDNLNTPEDLAYFVQSRAGP